MDFGQHDILMLLGLIGAFVIMWSSPQKSQTLQLKVLSVFFILGLFWLVVGTLLPPQISAALFICGILILAYWLYRYHFNFFREKSLEHGFIRTFSQYFVIMGGGICLSWVAYSALHLMLAVVFYATLGVAAFTAYQMEQVSNNLFLLFDVCLNSMIIFSLVTLPSAIVSLKLVTKNQVGFNEVFFPNLKAIGAATVLCLFWLACELVRVALFPETKDFFNVTLAMLIIACFALYTRVYGRALQLPDGQKIGDVRVAFVLALQILMSLLAVALYMAVYLQLWRLL